MSKNNCVVILTEEATCRIASPNFVKLAPTLEAVGTYDVTRAAPFREPLAVGRFGAARQLGKFVDESVRAKADVAARKEELCKEVFLKPVQDLHRRFISRLA